MQKEQNRLRLKNRSVKASERLFCGCANGFVPVSTTLSHGMAVTTLFGVSTSFTGATTGRWTTYASCPLFLFFSYIENRCTYYNQQDSCNYETFHCRSFLLFHGQSVFTQTVKKITFISIMLSLIHTNPHFAQRNPGRAMQCALLWGDTNSTVRKIRCIFHTKL